jgi:predicted nucleic acid-binding protein
VTKLADSLRGVTRLGLDTVPFIYFVEARQPHLPLVDAVIQHIDRGDFDGVTSVITLAEVLVHPFLHNDQMLQQEYRDLLLRSRNFETVDIDVPTAEHAAELRARYRLTTPDALQLAVALDKGCEAFLTNDLTLKRVTELRVLVLDELEL